MVAGIKTSFSLQTRDKHGNKRESGGETFKVILKPKNSTETNNSFYKTDIVDSNDGKYLVNITPEKSGEYDMQILFSEKEIQIGKDIPIFIEDSGETDPSKCTISFAEDFKKLKAGERRSFTVQTRDKYGNPRKNVKSEKYQLFFFSKSEKEEISDHGCEYTSNIEEGTFHCSFSLKKADTYALQCIHSIGEKNGSNISNFPSEVVVTESGVTDPYKTQLNGEGIKRSVSNQPSSFKILLSDKFGNLRKAGGDKVSVSLVNEKRKIKVDADITDLEDGTYDCHYLPTTSGDYQIIIKINGVEIDAKKLLGDSHKLMVEPPPAKELKDNELLTIQDHDLLSSLVNSFLVEEDNQSLIEEIFKIRSQIIVQIKENTEKEKQIKELDRKIELLVKNRLKIDDLLKETKRGLFGRKIYKTDSPNEKKENSVFNDEKLLKLYSYLFYLLQTDGKYLSNVLYLVPDEQVDKFLETVILTLFGYAFSSREENLILSLFQKTLEIEISKAKKISNFLENNPVLPKMIMKYGRRTQGKKFLKKILFEKILSGVLNDKDLNLDLNAVKLFKDNISREEVKSGTKSTVNIRDVTNEMAMADESVKKVIGERISQLNKICTDIISGIIENIDQLPYGLRWICKQINKFLKEKHVDSTESERFAVVGYMAYYRFMNPVIVSPDAFGVTKKNQKINATQRNNLITISKILTQLTNNVLFVEASFLPMNDWIKKNEKLYEKFIVKLIEVGEPEDELGVNEFTELIQKKNPSISVTIGELVNTQKALQKFETKLAPSEKDPLRLILSEFNNFKIPDISNSDISELEIVLPLLNKFEENIQKAQQMTPKQIYDQTKENFRIILRTLPSDDLGESLINTLEIAKKYVKSISTEKSQLIQQKIDQIEKNIPLLEKEELITKKDNYRKILIDITKEIQNQKIIREKQKKELERLKESFKSLQDHAAYLKERASHLEGYIDDCRKKQFDNVAGPSKVHNSKRKKKKFTYKYNQLQSKGVIKKLDVPVNQRKNITFVLSML
jgi:Ras GTPase-activating-like protein IQGAP2/3